jgi:hypothetical protein
MLHTVHADISKDTDPSRMEHCKKLASVLNALYVKDRQTRCELQSSKDNVWVFFSTCVFSFF